MKNKKVLIITILLIIITTSIITINLSTAKSNSENENIATIIEDNKLKIINETTAIEVGEALTLIVQKESEIIANESINFEVMSPDIVTIDKKGVVTALSEGNATIKATYKDLEASIVIYVQDIKTSNANYIDSSHSGKRFDVVLMWGQSNMMGAAGKYEAERTSISAKNGYRGIYYDIVDHTKTDSYVEFSGEKCSTYEYKETDNNHLVDVFEINAKIPKTSSGLGTNSTRFGECLVYNSKTNELISGNCRGDNLYHSYGTNMIPAFAKYYCKKTGHNVVIVHAANPGKNITAFQKGAYKDANTRWYLYESMTKKYKNAINYLTKKGYIVNNKFYVVYQGEENAKDGKYNNYYNEFMKVHNDLIKDLDLSFGAIVYSARSPYSTSTRTGVKAVHAAQENLINKNSNIILGSPFPYQHYINNNKTPFGSNYIKEGNTIESNSVHLTAAGLSEVGRQVAFNVSDSGKLKN